MNGDRANFEAAVAQWRELLDSRASEAAYHSFLSLHAGQFFCLSPCQAIVISKLKLSSAYETDFVVVEDDFSDGIKYTFVEIEVPHAKLFTKGNRPSHRLNTAISQINAWKQWLETYTREALDILPSFPVSQGTPPKYRFMVIMGRRTSEIGECLDVGSLKTRAWLSKLSGIEVRSFDFLTSLAEMAPNGPVGTISHYPPHLETDLFQREWSAISHREWVQFISSQDFRDFHLHEFNWAGLLKMRGMESSLAPRNPN
jgi:hypothetical protein